MSGSVKVVTVRSGGAGGAPADRFVVFLFIKKYEIIGKGLKFRPIRIEKALFSRFRLVEI